MRRDTSQIQAAIIAAADEVGMDRATALAIAERESSFNPSARSSKTIRGLYQMRGDHRAKAGIGDSDDVATQVKGWVPFFRQVQKEMAGPLGRAPSDAEGYLGHHFGGVRAGRMLKMAPDTPVDSVFTPREMAENPHFSKAGTVGNLLSSVTSDIEKRQAKFGGAGGEPADFSQFGEPVNSSGPGLSSEQDQGLGGAKPSSVDFSSASSEGPNLNMGSAPAASSAPDFSNFGVPA